jgi:hypothetical protein
LEEQKGKLGNHNNKGLRAFWLVCPWKNFENFCIATVFLKW